MKKLFRYKSLSARLCAIVCLITTIIITVVAVYVFALKSNEETLAKHHDVSLRLANTALTVDKHMSHLQANMTGNQWHIDRCVASGRRDSVISVLLQIIDLTHGICGCGVAFDADAAHDAHIRYATMDSTVHNIPLAQGAQGATSAYAWLQRTIDGGEPCWCSTHPAPHDPEISVCTYAIPISDQRGRWRVVFFADVPQDVLERLITSNLSDDRCSTLLVDDQGRCIFYDGTSPDDHHHASLRQSEVDQLMANVTAISDDHTGTFDYEFDQARRPVFYSMINNAGWSLLYVADISRWSISKHTLPVILMFVLTIILLYMVLSMAIRKATLPLRLFSDSAIEISKGNFNAELPRVDTDDEMALLHDSFEKMQQSLSHYMRELADSTRSQAFIMSELQIASRIQDDLLPKVFPPFPGRDDINIRAALIPARQIGGDLYNYFLRDGKVFFIIADVSGKSVPAAIVMAIACNVFNTVGAHSDDAAQIMEELNAVTCANNAHSGFFITALVGVLDLAEGRLTLCNAGHDPSLLISPSGQVSLVRIAPNLPAGVMVGMRYQSQVMDLQPGTRLFMYTDGITEAEDSQHQFYGIDRLSSCIAAHARQDIGDVIDAVVRDVHEFAASHEQSDDLTMMMIDYTPSDVRMPRSITLSSDIEQLGMVGDFAEAVASSASLPHAAAQRLNLVLEEVCSNIMKYAFNGWQPDAITLYASLRVDTLYIIVSDDGRAFDPTRVSDADTSAPLEERPVGGLGITLVRRYTKSMRYSRVNNRNHLTLAFDLEQLSTDYRGDA